MPFDPSPLSSPDFSATLFVRTSTEHVSLDALVRDLTKHHDGLSAQLVDLVHHEYAQFAALASRLRTAGRRAGSVAESAGLAEREARLAVGVASELASRVRGLLEEKERVEHRREELEMFLGVDMGLRKLEHLLGIHGSAPAAGNGGESSGGQQETPGPVLQQQEDIVTIERAAAELYQLHFRVRRGEVGDHPFIKARAARIATIEGRLGGMLRSRFEGAVTSGDPDQISHCLRAYTAIDRVAEAESLYGEFAVRPVVERVFRERLGLEPGAAPPPASNPGHHLSGASLRKLFSDLVDDVAAATERFLSLDALRLCGCRAVSHAIWPEINRGIETYLGSALFSHADPSAFQGAHLASISFLESIELVLCGSDEETVAALRSHPSHAAFVERWRINLPVYFGLRAREITAAVDAALGADGAAPSVRKGSSAPADNNAQGKTGGKKDPNANGSSGNNNKSDNAAGDPNGESKGSPGTGPDGFILPAFRAVALAHRRVHDPSVHLRALADRFVGLTLQLNTRVREWLAVGLADPKSDTKDGAKAWQLTAEELADLYHDVCRLRSFIVTKVPSLVRSSTFPESRDDEGALPALEKLLQSHGRSLGDVASRVRSLAVTRASQRPLEALQAMRSLTATYRLVHKETPSRPSIYVANVCRPVAQFANAVAAVVDGVDTPGDTDVGDEVDRKDTSRELSGTPPSVAWTTRVVDTVAGRFAELAAELIENMRQTENSLRRLKASQGDGSATGGATGTSGSSGGNPRSLNSDKIFLQMSIDVDEFARLCVEMGVDPKPLASYAKLRSVVRNAASA